MRVGVYIALCHLVLLSPAAAQQVEIRLANGSEREQQVQGELQQLLDTYPLDPWLFTRVVEIDEDAIPHSHPVLTLHTRHRGYPLRLLSTFLHEQLHWFVHARPERRDAAIAVLRTQYPDVPVGYPEGGSSEHSTYLHLLVNTLEYAALQELLGAESAYRILTHWTGDHYTWIYQTVLDDEADLRPLLREHELDYPGPDA